MSNVYRVINYGGYYRDSVTGGSGVEFYGVEGLPPQDKDAAHLLGLPSKGQFHVDPRLAYIGTVQYVEVVQEFGPLGYMARAYYSVGGTFNFGVRLGSTISNTQEMMPMPIMGNAGTVSSGPGAVFFEVVPKLYLPRYGFTRVESVRSSLLQATIQSIANENINRIYNRDGFDYQLVHVAIVTDQGNNTRVDTWFRNRGPMNGGAPGAFTGQDVAIPDLPPNCDWHMNTVEGIIQVVDPADRYPIGDTLPWLP